MNIYSYFKNTIEKYGISKRLFKIVTDGASNMCKAFESTIFDIENEKIKKLNDMLLSEISKVNFLDSLII